MNLNKKIGRIFKFVLSLTMAMAICIGNFIDTNQMFKVSAGATVATLTIHSDPTGGFCGLPTGQHAFLSIRNKTKNKINILGTMVEPDGAITIGTRPSLGGKGYGIYTNAEAWLLKYKGYYKNRVSLSMNIDSSQLYTVTDTMLHNNLYIATERNCSWFCIQVWNSVASGSNCVGAGLRPDPYLLAKSIKSRKGWKKAQQIGTCDKTNVRRVYSLNNSVKVDMKKAMK